jgi:hypothetical protein
VFVWKLASTFPPSPLVLKRVFVYELLSISPSLLRYGQLYDFATDAPSADVEFWYYTSCYYYILPTTYCYLPTTCYLLLPTTYYDLLHYLSITTYYDLLLTTTYYSSSSSYDSSYNYNYDYDYDYYLLILLLGRPGHELQEDRLHRSLPQW